MRFETLQDKCNYFRSLSDYRLTPNGYVIAMLDGRAFSKLIKNKYKKPFDPVFMDMMNKTAQYLCQNIQGAKLAYVQSDEISILITDFDTPDTDSAFGYRICKLQSIMAAMAASKFNQLALVNEINSRSYDKILLDCEDTIYEVSDAVDIIEAQKLAEFDCKVWNVPDYNTAYCHFLWRQNDCTKNSKQQAAQTYLPHKELLGKTSDEQVELLRDEKGIDWNDYTDGEKYGRLIYREEVRKETTFYDKKEGREVSVSFTRNEFVSHYATPFNADCSIIKTLIPKRND